MFVKVSSLEFHESKIRELTEKLHQIQSIDTPRARSRETTILEGAIRAHKAAATDLIRKDIEALTVKMNEIRDMR